MRLDMEAPMISYECLSCSVRWAPYMTDRGACPTCGSGTIRKQRPADPDIHARYELVREARSRTAAHEAFDAFYMAREAEALWRVVDELLGDAEAA